MGPCKSGKMDRELMINHRIFRGSLLSEKLIIFQNMVFLPWKRMGLQFLNTWKKLSNQDNSQIIRPCFHRPGWFIRRWWVAATKLLTPPFLRAQGFIKPTSTLNMSEAQARNSSIPLVNPATAPASGEWLFFGLWLRPKKTCQARQTWVNLIHLVNWRFEPHLKLRLKSTL